MRHKAQICLYFALFTSPRLRLNCRYNWITRAGMKHNLKRGLSFFEGDRRRYHEIILTNEMTPFFLIEIEEMTANTYHLLLEST